MPRCGLPAFAVFELCHSRARKSVQYLQRTAGLFRTPESDNFVTRQFIAESRNACIIKVSQICRENQTTVFMIVAV